MENIKVIFEDGISTNQVANIELRSWVKIENNNRFQFKLNKKLNDYIKQIISPTKIKDFFIDLIINISKKGRSFFCCNIFFSYNKPDKKYQFKIIKDIVNFLNTQYDFQISKN